MDAVTLVLGLINAGTVGTHVPGHVPPGQLCQNYVTAGETAEVYCYVRN